MQQIGWCQYLTPFTNSEGVGDDTTSYGVDGYRICLWHSGKTLYGKMWDVGDVIGCGLDLEQKKIEACKRMSKVLPPIPGKVWHFMLSSVSGCRILIDVLLLGYFCQSINHLDVAICRIKCHQQIENSFNLITSTSRKCK